MKAKSIKKQKNKLAALQNELNSLTKSYPIDPSLLSVMGISGNCKFDPSYVIGSSDTERAAEKHLISLTREDIARFLDEPKNLSLNEYAAQIAKERSIQVPEGKVIVANCSGKDLAGLDFSGKDISGCCFAGADLRDCTFNNTNLSKSTFEKASLAGSTFSKVDATRASFFSCDLDQVNIKEGSDFDLALMSYSKMSGAIEKSTFNYIKARHAQWSNIGIDASEFNGADMENIALTRALIKATEMKNAILSKAKVNVSVIEDSDLHKSNMSELKATNLTVINSNLTDANMTKVEINELNAQKVDFSDSKMEGAHINGAFQEVVFDKSHLRGLI